MSDHLSDVMKRHLLFDPAAEWMSTPAADPDDYVFTTPAGAPIDEANFYHREWLPMLRRLKIRPLPFYNTRHSYELHAVEWSYCFLCFEADRRHD
jgi:hypothetical protein